MSPHVAAYDGRGSKSPQWWPSRYGPDDEAGALNEITPERTMAALALPTSGRIIELAPVLELDMPGPAKREWRQILATIERDLCLVDKWQGMLADDLADYLFARTTGHFASLMSLIGRGAHRAISTGQERLTADLLDKVKIDAAAETSAAYPLAV